MSQKFVLNLCYRCLSNLCTCSLVFSTSCRHAFFGGTERVRNIVWLRVKSVHYLGNSEPNVSSEVPEYYYWDYEQRRLPRPGLCAAPEHRRLPAVQLLVVRDPGRFRQSCRRPANDRMGVAYLASLLLRYAMGAHLQADPLTAFNLRSGSPRRVMIVGSVLNSLPGRAPRDRPPKRRTSHCAFPAASPTGLELPR